MVKFLLSDVVVNHCFWNDIAAVLPCCCGCCVPANGTAASAVFDEWWHQGAFSYLQESGSLWRDTDVAVICMQTPSSKLFCVQSLKSLDLLVGLTPVLIHRSKTAVPVVQGVAGFKAINFVCAIVTFYSVQKSLATALMAFRFRLSCPFLEWQWECSFCTSSHAGAVCLYVLLKNSSFTINYMCCCLSTTALRDSTNYNSSTYLAVHFHVTRYLKVEMA